MRPPSEREGGRRGWMRRIRRLLGSARRERSTRRFGRTRGEGAGEGVRVSSDGVSTPLTQSATPPPAPPVAGVPPSVEDTTLVAAVNRLFEEFHFGDEDGIRSSRRRSLRFPAQYFVNVRAATLELPPDEGEMLFGVRPVRVIPGRACTHGDRATEDEIRALPCVTLEKEETRSLREVFADMDGKSATLESEGKGAAAHGGTVLHNECAICLAEFETGDEVTALPCGHYFHLESCVRVWLKNHSATCPTCRAEISPRSASARRRDVHHRVVGDRARDDVTQEALDVIMRTIVTNTAARSQAEWRDASLSARERTLSESATRVR